MLRGCVLGPGAQMKQGHTSSTVSLPQAPPGGSPSPRAQSVPDTPGRAEAARCSLEVSIMKAVNTHHGSHLWSWS